MEDTDAYLQQLEMPPQQLGLDDQKAPSKFNSNFLYKALSVAIVLVVLPLFPSQAPEFINQTVFTRSWELLHLLFVGVAVSYGLFSRRNVETEKENQLKIDTTQAYMSRILQVSSVFDDEVETPLGFDENRTQTWNSKYFRGNPLVVEQESPALDEQSATVSNVSNNKPLFLPVRSLKSAVSDSDSVGSVGESVESLGSLSRSGSASGSKSGSSGNGRTREFGDMDPLDFEEKVRENVVLPSPVPWRTRSGRMEMKEETGDANPPPYSLPPSMDEPEFDHQEFQSFPSPVPRSSHPKSTSPSPKRLSPSNSLSPEMRAKNNEDYGKKKKNGYNKSSPPPPPPLPPLMSHKSPSIVSKSRFIKDAHSSDKKAVKGSVTEELKDLSRSSREEFRRGTDYEIDYFKSETNHRSQYETPSVAKSVRTIRGGGQNGEANKYREYEERTDLNSDKRSKEVNREFVDKPRRTTVGFNQQLVSPEPENGEVPRHAVRPTLPKYQKKEKKKLAEKVIMESEEYTSSEDDDDIQGSSNTGQVSPQSVVPDPNEVDKKADEFIAKFREQIRLQRIESVRRTNGQPR